MGCGGVLAVRRTGCRWSGPGFDSCFEIREPAVQLGTRRNAALLTITLNT